MTDWLVREASVDDVPDIIEVFHASRRAAMPWLPVLHTPDEDTTFFRRQVERGPSWLVSDTDALLGFAICSPGWLDHLYVRPGDRGRGVGSALLAQAKHGQPDGLDLWVFQRNVHARAFYARRGFVEVSLTDGEANEEKEPDALMRWPGL